MKSKKWILIEANKLGLTTANKYSRNWIILFCIKIIASSITVVTRFNKKKLWKRTTLRNPQPSLSKN